MEGKKKRDSWINVMFTKAFILFSLCASFSIMAQNSGNTFKVTGVVKDGITGDPMLGAVVLVKESKTGTVTDINGAFTINVRQGDIVRISYIGYKEAQLTVKNNNPINITLEELAKALNEVEVNAGYGTIKKKDVISAAMSVSKDDIEKRTPTTVLEALQGVAAGVQVNTGSSAPGSTGSIRIRGTSTLSDAGVNPLYVVDGMIVDDISGMNPNDIASMEVLKDAASSSIYGSRSANGVILITTKIGKTTKPVFDVRYLNSYSQLSNKVPQSNALQRRIWNSLPANGVHNTQVDSLHITRNSDNDYQDLLTQIGVRHQLDVSLTGGTNELKYYNSFQIYDETGIIINSWYKRYTGRINVDYSPNKKITLSSRLSFESSDRNNIWDGTIISALRRPANFLLFFPDGTPVFNNGGERNPVMQVLLTKNLNKQNNLSIYQSLDYKITKLFTWRTDVSGRFGYRNSMNFSSQLLNTANPSFSTGSTGDGFNTNLSFSSYFTYKNKFKKHNAEIIGGFSYEDWFDHSISIQGKNYVSEVVTTANSISEILPNGTRSFDTSRSLIGQFIRGRYDYQNRYLLNATIRRDGSSRFGKSNRWGLFPSVALGWRLSDEKFMNWSKNILSDAKLRASWGITGNERIGDYDAQIQYVFGGVFYNNSAGVVNQNTLGNPDLKWEETIQKNIGADLMLFEGRMKFVADYYIKDTKDILYNTSLPKEIGYGNMLRNIGVINNKGLELSLSITPVKTKNVEWSTVLNYSENKNTIVKLENANRADEIWWIGEGYAAGVFYGYRSNGIYQYNESNAWTPDFKTRLIPQFETDQFGNVILGKDFKPILLGYIQPDGTLYNGAVSKQTIDGKLAVGGDVIWQEIAGKDGKIDGNVTSNDRQILGQGQPKWFGSWNNTIKYKDFSVSFNFYGSFGNLVMNEGARSRSAANQTNNATPIPFVVENSWKYPGQNTPVYQVFDLSKNNARNDGNLYLEDGSFVRLQSLKFAYTLNSKLAKKFKIKMASLNIYANNLLTWTNYTGYDPEIPTSVLKPGRDNGTYPRKREYGLGCNVQF